MNVFTYALHLLGSSATAYMLASQIRDSRTRPNTLAGFQLAESGAVPYLEALRDRAADEGDTWLAEKLASHAADERRHGQIFAHAIKQHGKQVIDFKQMAQKAQANQTSTDGKKPEERRSPFFAAYFEGYSPADLKPENIDWIVFMASTYILELDASKDFARMAHALPEDDPTCTNLKKGILSVAKDETGHAAYLREALGRRMDAIAVDQVIDQWRTRKVNAMLAMVTNLLQKSGQGPSLVQDGAPTEVSQPATESSSTEAIAA